MVKHSPTTIQDPPTTNETMNLKEIFAGKYKRSEFCVGLHVLCGNWYKIIKSHKGLERELCRINTPIQTSATAEEAGVAKTADSICQALNLLRALPIWSMTSMSPEVAELIIEAFGPCSVLYECTTPDELTAEFANNANLRKRLEKNKFVRYRVCDFVTDHLHAQGVYNERSSDAEGQQFLSNIVEQCKQYRLLPAMFTLESHVGDEGE